MNTFLLQTPQSCPSCRTVLTACTNATGDRKPGAGDFTVCVECAAVLRYRPDLSLLHVPLMGIPASIAPELFRVRAAVQLYQAHRRASMN